MPIKGHKFLSAAPNGTTVSDLEDAEYFNLAIRLISEESVRLKTAEMEFQVMLAHIDILLHLADKFLEDARLLVRKEDVAEWKLSFDGWFARCGKMIPKKFRQGVRDSADDLFGRLGEIAR